MNHPTYRPEIDGLRAVSIIAVVLFHANLPAIAGGFVGVDIFFVISGYLITRILVAEKLAEGCISLLRFYERRVRRILPALYVMMATTGMVCLFLYAPADLTRFSASATMAVLFSSNIYFWRSSGYFAEESEIAPLLHTWSLSVEEQFYFVWPVVFLLLFGRRGNILFGLAGSVVIISGAAATYGSINFPQPTFYLMPTRAFELMLGALLALPAVPKVGNRRLAEILTLAGMGAIITAIFLFDASTPFPGLYTLLPCLGATAIIWAGRESSFAQVLLANRPMVFIGLVSYSWYLWHWPVFAIWHYVKFGPPTALEAMIGIAMSFVLAILSWRFVERPFRRPVTAHAGPRQRWQTISTLGLAPGVTLLAAGVAIWQLDGLPSRVSPEVAELTRQAESIGPIRDCQLVYLDRAEFHPASECVDGADLPYTAILWGDSHASHFAPTLAALGNRDGFAFRLLSKSSCRPLIDIGTAHEPPVFKGDCEAFNNNVFELLESKPEITDVWLGSFWVAQAQSEERLNKLADDVQKVIAKLESMGRRVHVLGLAPHYPYDAGACAVRRERFPLSGIDCGELLSKRPEIVAVDQTLQSAAGARYISLLPIICPKGDCTVTPDGIAAYGDGHHFNAVFAAKLADFIR